jgi:hypothetical protein
MHILIYAISPIFHLFELKFVRLKILIGRDLKPVCSNWYYCSTPEMDIRETSANHDPVVWRRFHEFAR